DVVLTLFMALLSFVESAPQAYRLKAGNAASPISTFAGAIPFRKLIALLQNDPAISAIYIIAHSVGNRIVLDAWGDPNDPLRSRA
ncbi:MAG: hypothetical protein ACRECE_02850, partial [Xanthobacteraceae bacterium]